MKFVIEYLKIDIYSLMGKNKIELYVEKEIYFIDVSMYIKEGLAADYFNFLCLLKKCYQINLKNLTKTQIYKKLQKLS